MDIKLKILVVDDEENSRDLINRGLTFSGFSCVTACDGEGAIEKLQKDSSINFVITDLNMPKMDTIKLVQKIRCSDNKKLSKIPILLVCST